MAAPRSTDGAGVQDSRTAATRVGRWYAEGPEDRPFAAGDPAFSVFRVVSDDAAAPGCVTVENPAGQRFPLPIPLLDAIAAPTRLKAGDSPGQPIGKRKQRTLSRRSPPA